MKSVAFAVALLFAGAATAQTYPEPDRGSGRSGGDRSAPAADRRDGGPEQHRAGA